MKSEMRVGAFFSKTIAESASGSADTAVSLEPLLDQRVALEEVRVLSVPQILQLRNAGPSAHLRV